jgi:hypothetical protein
MINLDLGEFKERIQTECAAFGNRVFVSIPVDDLGIEQHESPACFIYPAEDSSEENSLQRFVRQRMESAITVEVVVRRTATREDRYGEADLAVLMQARRQAFDALQGWSPLFSETPIQHRIGGNKSDNKVTTEIRWTDTYFCKNNNTGRP